MDDWEILAALAEVSSLADHLQLPPEGIEEALVVDFEPDYLPDPEPDLILPDAEAYIKALFKGPILVAGNRLIN